MSAVPPAATPPTTVSPQPATPTPSHSISNKSFKELFLQQLTPRHQPSTRGRSERVQRFKYGESLTSDEAIARIQSAAEKSRQGRGRARGSNRGKGREAEVTGAEVEDQEEEFSQLLDQGAHCHLTAVMIVRMKAVSAAEQKGGMNGCNVTSAKKVPSGMYG